MAGFRKRSINGRDYWELTWREGARPRTQSLGPVGQLREAEVRELARRKGRQLLLAEHVIVKPAHGFTAWCRDYLSWHVAEYPDSHWRIADIVERQLLRFFENSTLDGITQIDVERFKFARLAEGAAAGTVTKEMRTLAAILNRAVALGLLARSVTALVKAPRSLNHSGLRYYTADDMLRIYAASVEPWHRWAWMLYAGTGARRMEGLNLKWRDVSADELHLVSTGEERTKSGLARTIPITAGAAEALAFFKTWEGKSDLYVLPRICPESLSRAAAKCIRRAKLPGSLHTFRHTFISTLARDPRIPVLAIKEWAGHSTLAVTEKYMHLRKGATHQIAREIKL